MATFYKNPLISIIIPVYNGERYLEETINSALNQTYSNWELIIIDDASTDKSPVIIKSYFKKHSKKIKPIKHLKNKGCPAASKNSGLKIAKGKYIAFLDQDDLWLPQKLEMQIKEVEQSPKIGLVACNASVLDQNKNEIIGNVWKTTKILQKQNLTKRLLLGNFILTSSCVLVRKEFFDRYGLLDEKFKIADDYDLWFRISRYYNIALQQKHLTIWRRTGQSTSFNEKKMLKDLIYFFEKRRKERFISPNLGLFSFRLGNYCLALKDFEEAKMFYQKAKKQGYENFKFKIIVDLLKSCPNLASLLIKIKRRISKSLSPPTSYLEIEK
jgi:glycosyltransferase involved in cell wall biosynthesis